MNNQIIYGIAGLILGLAILYFAFRSRPFQSGEMIRVPDSDGVPTYVKAKTQRERDIKAVNAGKCPDCGASGSLCEGPSGGMNVNTACDQCLMEFNIGFGFGTGAFMVDRTGRLTPSRGRLFGFTEADFAGKDLAA